MPTSPRNRTGLWEQLRRVTRYKLVIPLVRSPHPPEYTARGVYMGVLLGFTPLVGIQLWLITMFWLVARMHPKTDFHLIQGLAWVWVSNVFTMVPMYYAFYVTGQIMLGRFEDVSGYDSFAQLFNLGGWEGETFWATMANYFAHIWREFGLPLAIGWIPHGFIAGWLSYKIALKYLIRRRERMRIKREALANPSPSP